MKVLIYEPAGKGKLAQYCFQLANHLHNKYCEVTLVTATDWEMAGANAKFPVLSIYDHAKRKGNRQAMLEAVDRIKPDIIHWHWFPTLGSLDLPGEIKAIYGSKMAATVHNVVPHESRAGDMPRYRRMYEQMDKIIVHSVYDREMLTLAFKIAKNRIINLMSGSAVAAADSGQSLDEARTSMGIEPDAPVLLFFGYINRAKGLEYLIRATAKLKVGWPELKLIVAGKPVMPFEPLAELISSLDLETAVHLDLDYIDANKTWLYFSLADVVALPHIGAGQSPIIATAYQFAKPVVTTYPQWETVHHGQSGYLVRPGSVEELVKYIDKILSSPQKLASMSLYCQSLYQNSFSWQVIAGQTTEVYRSLL